VRRLLEPPGAACGSTAPRGNSTVRSHTPILETGASHGPRQLRLPEILPPLAPALTFFGTDDSGPAPELCFFARAFVATTLPHKRPAGPQFTRECYFYTLSLTAPEEVGLPYGRLPRLALSALTTAALRAKSPSIILDKSLYSWAVSLGLAPSYGPRGTIPALRSQLHQLLSTTVNITWDTRRRSSEGTTDRIGSAGFRIGYEHNLDSGAEPLQVRLSTDFYEQLRQRPVPLDMNILKSLRSPFQMDIYAWLSLRSLRTLRINRPEPVPWEVLKQMFGSDYAEVRQFRFNFLQALQKVARVYPDLRVETRDDALLLLPFPPSVLRRGRPTQPTPKKLRAVVFNRPARPNS
jgi:hypothetical protein